LLACAHTRLEPPETRQKKTPEKIFFKNSRNRGNEVSCFQLFLFCVYFSFSSSSLCLYTKQMSAPAPKPFFPRSLSAYAHTGGGAAPGHQAPAPAPAAAPKKPARAWPPRKQAKAPPPLVPATLPLVDLEDACMEGLARDQLAAAQLLARG
jgi:hypothetical protein